MISLYCYDVYVYLIFMKSKDVMYIKDIQRLYNKVTNDTWWCKYIITNIYLIIIHHYQSLQMNTYVYNV